MDDITASACSRSGLQWDYVTELRERWNVPIVVKGLVTAEDALLACQHGAAAVVVLEPRRAAARRRRCLARRAPRGRRGGG